MKAIDADALLARAIKERRFVVATKDLINPEITIQTAYKDLYEFIKQAPTLTLDDLRPKGRWEWLGPYRYNNDGMIGTCSVCKERLRLFARNYCPNCGADMRGGGEDG